MSNFSNENERKPSWGHPMTDFGIQPCTVCSATDSKFLFDKTSDGRGEGNISLYQCTSCKTVYLAKYNQLYDDGLYAYYQKYQGKNKEDLYNPLTRKSYKKVLRLLTSYGGGKSILDVGCGKGDFVDAALSEGYKVEGIELAQHAVDIAQGFGLPVSHLDFFSNKIEESSRDIVTMFEVIEHLPDPVAFLHRAEMVVRPGGLIYITTPNFNSLDRRVFGSKWRAIHREHLSYFTPSTLLGVIRKNTALELLHSETRNVSEELIDSIKNLVRRKSSQQIEQNPIIKSGTENPTDFRTRIEKSTWLLLLKRGANSALSAMSLGSTIVMILRRPE